MIIIDGTNQKTTGGWDRRVTVNSKAELRQIKKSKEHCKNNG